MPARSSKDRDFATIARSVVEKAIGEHLDGTALEKPKEKNQAAVALGRLGGLKGGKARAKKLDPAKLSEIGRKGAKARWEE
jgi:hypothetical protein